jgi:transposase
MACERDPSARCGTLTAADRNCGARGGPDGHRRRPRHHRRQITYDWIDTETSERCRGQLSPATRPALRAWLGRFSGQQADFALEATTGWWFVAEAVVRAGFGAHLAEPADTRALSGPKRPAKTDRTDAHHLRELLHAGTLPESWMPRRTSPTRGPSPAAPWAGRRADGLVPAYPPDLVLLRAAQRSQLLTADGRARLASIHLPVVPRQAVDLALQMIDHLEVELDRLDTQLVHIARA